MDYQNFIQNLPKLYENWGQSSVSPKSNSFQQILEHIDEQIPANIMQLLNFAVSFMEPNEVYCQVGLFQIGTLIGALQNNYDKMAYAVDNFSEFDVLGDSFNKLIHYLSKFSLEEQVFLCNQDVEEFLFELRNLETEDKIGVYFYNGSHDYRSHFMALLLAKPLLADRAIIVISHNNWDTVQQATNDFLCTHPQCQMLLDLAKTDDYPSWNGLQIFSWDAGQTHNYEFSVFQKLRNQFFLQSISNLPSQERKEITDTLERKAVALYASKSFTEAEQKYKDILQIDRHNSAAWLNLGIFYYMRKQNQDAVAILLKSIEINPEKASQHYYLGLVLEQMGDTQQAIQAYQQSITLDPQAIQAYNNLGNILYEANLIDEAEAIYRKAIAANSEHFGSYINLGNLLMEQQQIDQAIEAYQKALQLEPQNSDIIYNLGVALDIKKEPVKASLYYGYNFYRRKNYKQAIKHFQHFKETQIGEVDFYISLADCYLCVMQNQEAVNIYRDGLSHYPKEPRLYFWLIIALQKIGSIEEAIETSREATLLLPDDLSLKSQIKLMLPIIYETPEEIDIYRQRFIEGLTEITQQTLLETSAQQKNALAIIANRTNFYLQYQGRNDLELQKQYGKLVHQVMAANYPQWVQPLQMPPATQTGKLRIGYISTLFKYHTVAKLVQGWLKNHNKNDFEIYCYHLGRETDFFTQNFLIYSDRFHHIPDDLEAASSQIVSDKLHILVFTDIGMDPLMTQMAGLRLAPVQCTSWGHPITSGSPTIDYYLSSDFMEPENAEKHYSEKLIRLPNLGFSYIKPHIPESAKTRADFGLRDDAIIFLSCQSTFKYLPQQDYIFAEIAKRVPQAQFAFICYNKPLNQKFLNRLQPAFAKLGLDSERHCTMVDQQSWPDYFKLNLVSDIFLDTFSWSGGNTTLEAIACNLPVVTCPGEFMRGRHSYAILKILGVTDTIAKNEAEYIDIAVKLALDPQWRTNIIQRMADRHSHLYEDLVCLQALEEFYRQVVQESRGKSSST